MKTEIIKARDRGLMKHTEFQGFTIFSNGEQNSRRPDHFGTVYVLNDDCLYPGSGLGMHPHDNVEIVTIMISGIESHQDTIGVHENYRAGDVQLISAGKGLYHAGGNVSQAEESRHLQIWIAPKTLDTEPAVAVRRAHQTRIVNEWEVLVSPEGEKDTVKINQDVWISRGQFGRGTEINYLPRKAGSGLLVYVLEGAINFEGLGASTGDTMLIRRSGLVQMDTVQYAEVLVIETVV